MTAPSERAPAVVPPDALAERLEAFAALKNCPSCGHVMELLGEGQRMCFRCERVAVCPPHEEWPAWLKRFIAWEHLRARIVGYHWHTRQHNWETALRDTMNGTLAPITGPNPFGYAKSTPASELWVPAVQRALTWHRTGELPDEGERHPHEECSHAA